MRAPAGIHRLPTKKGRCIAWLGAMAVASVFGTFAWLMAIVLFVVGAGVVHVLGLDVPSWTGWLALVGFPLGAYLEIRLSV